VGFLDDLLEMGTVFNWIGPAAAIAQNLADVPDGGSFTFLVSDSAGMTCKQMTDALRARGVRTRSHMVVNGQAMFTVSKKQERFARDILRSRGVSFT